MDRFWRHLDRVATSSGTARASPQGKLISSRSPIPHGLGFILSTDAHQPVTYGQNTERVPRQSASFEAPEGHAPEASRRSWGKPDRASRPNACRPASTPTRCRPGIPGPAWKAPKVKAVLAARDQCVPTPNSPANTPEFASDSWYSGGFCVAVSVAMRRS